MKSILQLLLTLSLSLVSLLSYSQLTSNHYYGNLHSHTSYSDGSKDSLSSGLKTPYEAYNFAKASLNFDFLGVSEHNHYSAGMNMPDYHRGLLQADSANEDSTFVALYGMEWGVISAGGHVLVYGSHELLGWESNNYDEYVANGNYQGLWNKINSRPGCFGMCAHPSNSDFDDLKAGAFNSSADKALVGTAFRSGPAFSTDLTYTNAANGSYESYYKALLARGYHVGPTYDHDNHNTTFGRTSEGRLVAIAPALTQADLMTAFRNRSFYASDDWNAQVTLSLNGHPMGAIVQEPAPVHIQATLTDLDGEGFTSFQLLKGIPGSGQNAQVVVSSTVSLLAYNETLAFGDSAYYYVSVTQPDGDRIITSPIWFKNGVLLDAQQPLVVKPVEVAVWPNPVTAGQGNFMVAAPAAGKITLLDPLGRIIRQANASITGTVFETEGLARGVYFIRVTSSAGVPLTTRLLVE